MIFPCPKQEKEIAVRGILDTNSQKVKVLIDGHSINDVWSGGISWNYDDLVVENIKRIEIIRGPVPPCTARMHSLRLLMS